MDNLGDYLTDEQIRRLAYWLAYVTSHGAGEVSITVSRGHVLKVRAEVIENLPYDKV